MLAFGRDIKMVDWVLVLLLIFSPILLIVGGLVLEGIMKWLDKLATGSMIITVLPEGKRSFVRSFVSLYIYYLMVSSMIAFMAKNLVITEFANISLEDLQLYILGLSLSFIPRAVKLATGVVEKARYMLLSILTPLTFMSLPLLVLQPQNVRLPTEGIYILPVGALCFTVAGDFFIYASIRLRLVQPKIDLETVGITNLRRNIESERMVDFANLCTIYNLAIERGRKADADKIADALEHGISLANKRQNQDVLTAILKAIPMLKDLNMLDTCANSCLSIIDEEFRDDIEKAVDRYLTSRTHLEPSDINKLQPLLGVNSCVQEYVMKRLSQIAKYDPIAIDTIKRLFKDQMLSVRRSATLGFFFLLETMPEAFDTDLIRFIGQVEEEHTKILATTLLRSIAGVMPEKIIAATLTLTSDMTGKSDVLLQVKEDAQRILNARKSDLKKGWHASSLCST